MAFTRLSQSRVLLSQTCHNHLLNMSQFDMCGVHLCHIPASDQRGHGVSEKGLDDYSRDAYVHDVIALRSAFCILCIKQQTCATRSC
jgi:hypothetical protein